MDKIIESLKEIHTLFNSINNSNINIDDKIAIETILLKNILFKESQLKQTRVKSHIYHLYHQRTNNKKMLLNLDNFIKEVNF